MSADPSSQNPITSFSTNSFNQNPYSTIALATVGGMALMFIGIMIGLPIFLNMALLIGGILLVYGFNVGSTTYSIYASGIEQLMRPFILQMLGRAPRRRFIEWQDIRSFKHDHEFSRSVQEYEYIKLYLKRSPGQIWITDQKNKEGFETFRDTFLALMEKDSAASLKQTTPIVEELVPPPPAAVSKENTSPTHHIRQRKSFYQTTLAKVITLLLLGMCVALAWFGFTHGMRWANWFRLAAILVPGSLYMCYRVFWKA